MEKSANTQIQEVFTKNSPEINSKNNKVNTGSKSSSNLALDASSGFGDVLTFMGSSAYNYLFENKSAGDIPENSWSSIAESKSSLSDNWSGINTDKEVEATWSGLNKVSPEEFPTTLIDSNNGVLDGLVEKTINIVSETGTSATNAASTVSSSSGGLIDGAASIAGAIAEGTVSVAGAVAEGALSVVEGTLSVVEGTLSVVGAIFG